MTKNGVSVGCVPTPSLSPLFYTDPIVSTFVIIH